MNKKLSRLLEPNLRLYFLLFFLMALAAIPFQPVLAAVEAAVTAALYVVYTKNSQKRRQGILQYIDKVTVSVDTASKSTLINSPLPILVFRPDTGEVIWSNENFQQLAGVRDHLFEMKVEDAVPDFPSQWLLEGKQECPDRVEMNSRRFRVYGSLVRAKGKDGPSRTCWPPPTGWTPRRPTPCARITSRPVPSSPSSRWTTTTS
jgi:c-di-AMP phosphodiesterase-like protein